MSWRYCFIQSCSGFLKKTRNSCPGWRAEGVAWLDVTIELQVTLNGCRLRNNLWRNYFDLSLMWQDSVIKYPSQNWFSLNQKGKFTSWWTFALEPVKSKISSWMRVLIGFFKSFCTKFALKQWFFPEDDNKNLKWINMTHVFMLRYIH